MNNKQDEDGSNGVDPSSKDGEQPIPSAYKGSEDKPSEQSSPACVAEGKLYHIICRYILGFV